MLTYPEFDPVIFALGPLKIRWYGMMYVVGFVAGWWLAKRRAQQAHSTIKPEQVDDLVFYVMLGVILGGRLGYTLFYGWQDIAADPLYIFKIWEGGMSFHGGLAGVLIAMWLYGRKLGNTLWQMTDFVAPLVPIGLGMGRIGNFINGELWGKPTDMPWGVMYRGQVLHPNQLYEALSGRPAAVPDPVVLFGEAAALHGRLRAVPAAVRHLQGLHRILPRAGCTHRLPRRRLGDDGACPECPHDCRGRCSDVHGIPRRQEGRLICSRIST